MPQAHRPAAADPHTPRAAPPLHWLCDGAAYGLSVQREVLRIDSRHQCIQVWDTAALGRILLLDGRPMTATGDAFIYHECMTHPAALCHPAPRRALILGGGDGGAARELLRHPTLETIVVAELDAAVVAVARQCLAQVHQGAFDDARVSLTIGDAADYVNAYAQQSEAARFDLVVFDLTPPDSPARELFTPGFLARLKTLLSPDALLSMHLGAPVFQAERVQQLLRDLRSVFRHVAVCTAAVPVYGGLWAMALASDGCDAAALTPQLALARWSQRQPGTLQYYRPELHDALFTLPRYIQDLLGP